MLHADLKTALEPTKLADDAVEVGRITGAWGVKGWVKILPYSALPEALFSCKKWYLLPSEKLAVGAVPIFEGAMKLSISSAKPHSDAVVAKPRDINDRDAAEQLKGARIFIPRSMFPTPQEGEYYWVDLIGLDVINRENQNFGKVVDLISTGPQQVLVIHNAESTENGKVKETLIPFVGDVYIDNVDLNTKIIKVDWQE